LNSFPNISSLSIVIPAYNEESRLPASLAKIEDYLAGMPGGFVEILVVDDGSRDGTVSVVEEFARKVSNVRVLRNPGNRGKGFSVRHGMLEARGEWCLFTDADLSAPIDELGKLWDAIQTQGADVAIGSRAIDRSLIGVHQSPFREISGKVFNAVMQLTVGLRISDTQCGFKLFRADVARQVFSRQLIERWGFDVEVLFIARKRGFKIAEVPVRWDNVEGSKLGVFNGVTAFVELAKVRMNDLQGKYRRESNSGTSASQ
jgi:glycosyltransferase involved in cell wall biosynthesis